MPWPLETFFCWSLPGLGHENIWLKKKSLNIEQMMSFGNLGHSVALLPPDEGKDWFPEEVSVQQVIL